MRKGILAAALSLLGGGNVAWGQDMMNGAPACTSPRIWGSAEYLLWWVKNQDLSAPLLTTSSNPGVTDANGFNVAGGLGRNGTSVLVGDGGRELDYGALSGARLTIGAFLDSEGTFGAEVRGFMLERGSTAAGFASNAAGVPGIFVPINLTGLGAAGGDGETSINVADGLGFQSGSAVVVSTTRLWGFEANGVWNFTRSEGLTIDILGGFRYVDLREDLLLSTTTQSTPAGGGLLGPGVLPLGASVTTADVFQTRNQFYGGQLGVRGEAEFGRAFVGGTFKLALGNTSQTVNISGNTVASNAGAVLVTAPGGLLALPSNAGQTSRDLFTVIPEVELKVGYKLTDSIRGFVGYNFMYWSDVARPGQQIDHTVDIRQIPSVGGAVPPNRASPAPQNNSTGFWAQGINFGLEIKY